MAKSLTIEQYQVITGELDMLRDYTKVLEAENRSRDQERKILEKQISRLNNIIVSNPKTYSSQNCGECATLKSEIIKFQNQIERLKRENTNLQSNNNVLSQNLARVNSTNAINQSVVTNSRITVVRSSNSRQVENSNITLGPTGNINGGHEDISQFNNKMQSVGNQNIRLKKQLQKYRQLQINVVKLNSEKQTLSIKITTLQQQIHNLKTTIFNKDNQIFNFKTKLQSQTSSISLQTQLKSVKQSLKTKQSELTQAKQKISSFTSLQFELRNTKYSIQTKQNEIGNLKSQISRMEQQATNVYKLEGEIRNLKYQITSKDSQMQGLINKIAQIQAGEQVHLQNKDKEISQLRSQVSQKQFLRSQIDSLQKQSKSWKAKFQEQEKQSKVTSSVQPVSTSISTQYGEQISYLNIQIARVKTQSSDKDVYIRKIQDQLKELTERDLQKQLQVKKLDKIVNSYLEKIGELQNQINKLEKSSVYSSGKNNSIQPNIVEVVNNEEIMLLSEQNRILNEKIEDQSRRIALLEQTNLNLREQLKHSIQIRSRQASRLIIGQQQPQFPDEQLLTVIKLLKLEVEEIKIFNNKLKSDNQYLQAKLSSCELEIQNLTNFGKGPNYVMGIGLGSNRPNQNSKIDPMGLNIITTNKILSSVPITETNKVFISQTQKQRQMQREYQKEREKRQREISRLKQGQKSKSVKKLIKQQNITVLDEKERDPVTSSVLSSNSPKTRFKQKEKKSLGNKQAAQISQASRNRLSLDQSQGNYSKFSSNLSNISPSNGSNLTNTINSSNLGINANINGSHASSNLSVGRKGQYDDLQKRIQMLKQENKGLRKHLYEPPV